MRPGRTQALLDNNTTEASEQIKGLLDLVSSTQVHADHDNEEEAIGFLVCGHRSVVGPEISVGDDVVTWAARKDDDDADGCDDNDDGHDGSLEIRKFPSKKR